MFENVGEIVLLFWRTLLALPHAWRQRQKVFEQFFEIGNASLLMVCVLSFFIGAVIALQTGPILVERSLASAVRRLAIPSGSSKTGLRIPNTPGSNRAGEDNTGIGKSIGKKTARCRAL